MSITVPTEQWQKFASSNACMAASSFKPDNGVPLRVNSTVWQGQRYAVFGSLHSSYGNAFPTQAWAYQLALPALFQGETTLVYHDEKAISEGQRERGDHTGLLVTTDNQTLVCAKRVTIYCGLPQTKPLTLDLAKAMNNSRYAAGWRAHASEKWDVTWHSLEGHPVVRHQGKNRELITTLLWSVDRKELLDLRIDNQVVLDSADELLGDISRPAGVINQQSQIALFG